MEFYLFLHILYPHSDAPGYSSNVELVTGRRSVPGGGGRAAHGASPSSAHPAVTCRRCSAARHRQILTAPAPNGDVDTDVGHRAPTRVPAEPPSRPPTLPGTRGLRGLTRLSSHSFTCPQLVLTWLAVPGHASGEDGYGYYLT